MGQAVAKARASCGSEIVVVSLVHDAGTGVPTGPTVVGCCVILVAVVVDCEVVLVIAELDLVDVVVLLFFEVVVEVSKVVEGGAVSVKQRS